MGAISLVLLSSQMRYVFVTVTSVHEINTCTYGVPMRWNIQNSNSIEIFEAKLVLNLKVVRTV